MGAVHPFFLMAVVIAAPPPSAADLGKDPQPVVMTARGGIQVDLKRRVGVAHDDVVISRDDVTVCCDRAEAVYDKDKIRKVTCTGRVVIVRPDGTKASAHEALFEAVANRVTLQGGAKVWSKDAHLTGARIVYDIGLDTLSVVGGDSRFSFDPKGSKPPTDLRACPPAAPRTP